MQQFETLFDSAEADRRMEAGIALASSSQMRNALLRVAQGHARSLCVTQGWVTSDCVCRRMAERGFDYADLGNAAGAVFRGGFSWTGEVQRSTRVSTHGRIIRVWRIRND
jgi:hypothetical protein